MCKFEKERCIFPFSKGEVKLFYKMYSMQYKILFEVKKCKFNVMYLQKNIIKLSFYRKKGLQNERRGPIIITKRIIVYNYST
ncbi:hypothetical protein SAMN03080599_02404 [Acidaminobacter hydrogenoformans DSM 2784]|uniref:Uncharacterized protein n=1 Tax=Acidaminobacter hydrogenoformans DSM 2784 TaxID=1120920 RepID=A0A1G5S2U2_9FIRM|nr:hypothetical protein SAMN03080599_02404 [Acidaminobacter hydrogenoformans DSM 2784]